MIKRAFFVIVLGCIMVGLLSQPRVDAQQPPNSATVTPTPTPRIPSDLPRPIQFGVPVAGELDENVFRQFWRFEARAGSIVDIRMDADSGDLDPFISLISPLGDILLSNDSATGGRNAGILAYQLPFTGEYTLLATRIAATNGRVTTGRYNLILDLRSPGTAAENTVLEPNRIVAGRLNQNAPMAVYRVEVGGRLVFRLDLGAADRLARLRLISTTGTILSEFVGLSPLLVPVSVPTGAVSLLEVSAPGANESGRVDYELTSFKLTGDPKASRPLRPGFPRQSEPTAPESWFFTGAAGDLVRLEALPIAVQGAADTQIRVFNAENPSLVQGTLGVGLRGIFALPADGLYEVEVRPAEGRRAAYRINLTVIGAQNAAFERFAAVASLPALRPDQAVEASLKRGEAVGYPLDAPAGTILSVEASPLNGADTLGLGVLSPSGELITAAASRGERGAVLSRVLIPQGGRYQLVVFDGGRPIAPTSDNPVSTAPIAYRIHYSEEKGGILQAGQVAKGIVSPTDGLATWGFDVPSGALINLRLENLTPIAWSPRLYVLNPDGQVIAQREAANPDISLFGVQTVVAGRYTVVVIGAVTGTYASYRLESALQFPFATTDGQAIQIESAVALPDAGRYAPLPPEGALQTDLRALISPAVNPQNLPPSEVGALAFGRTVRGEIGQGKLAQAWQISVSSDVVVQLRASSLSRAEPPSISLWNGSGQLVYEQFGADSPVTTLSYRVVRGGAYFVVITMGLDGGRYLLSLENTPLAGQNVIVGPGKPLDYGQAVSGEILSAGETDVYYFSGTLNDVVSTQLFRSSGTFLPGLELRGPTGRLLIQSDSVTERPFAVLNGLRLQESGVFSLTVQNRNQVGRSEGRYRLYLGLQSGTRTGGRGGGILQQGQTSIGRLVVGDSADDWLFEGREGQVVTFITQAVSSPAPLPLTLQLLDTGGSTLAIQTIALEQGAARIEGFVLPGTGVYRVRVSGGAASGGVYSLTWQAASLRGQTGAIRYGQTVNGLFSAQRRFESWTFSGTKDDVVAVSLRYQFGALFTGSFQIRAANGVVLATVADFDGTGARAEVLLPFSGAYSIVAGNPDPEFQGVGVYALTLNLRDSGAPSAGGVITYGQSAVGRLVSTDPTDTWVFAALAGDQVRIGLSGRDSFFRPVLELRSIDDTVLASAQASDDLRIAAVGGQGAEFTIPADGVYVITVGATPDGLGSYLLSLDYTPAPVADIDQLTYGGSVNGIVADDRPEESYLFSGGNGDLITASVLREPGANLSVILTLIAPDGATLARSDSNDSDSAAIEAFRLPQIGVYRLVVSRFGRASGQTVGRYTLALTGKSESRSIQGTTRYGTSAIGRLNAAGPLDRITFTGKAGDVIGVVGEATSENLDITLAVERPDGKVLAANDDAIGTDAAITGVQLPSDGEYIIAVGRAGASEGNYTLNLSLLYQHSTATAAPERTISYGERITGALDAANPRVTFTFVGAEGDEIAVQMLHQNDDAPPILTLQAPGGQVLAEGKLTVGLTSLPRFRLPADGAYILALRRPANTQGQFSPYTLALGLADAQAASGRAGGVLRTAGGGGAITGAFTPGQSAHYWLFGGQAGQGVTLSLLWLGGEGLPSALVLTPDGRALTTLNLPTRGGAAVTAQLALPADGVYSVLVLPGGGTGGYRLGLQVSETPPNDSEVLISGIGETGALDAVRPAQRYRFVGAAGQALSAQMLATSDSLLPRLTLAGTDGQILAESALVRTGQGTAATLAGFPLPQTGEYTLFAEATDQTSGTYRLLIQLGSADAPLAAEAVIAQRVPYNQPIRAVLQANSTALWAFLGQAGDSVAISAALSNGQRPPKISVKDSAGRVLAIAEPPTDPAITETAIAEFTVPADGRYIVALQDEESVAYTLIILRRNDFAPVETARPPTRPLPPNTPQQNSITNADNVDYWTFTGKAGQIGLVEVQRINGTLRPDVTLYGPSGFVAASAAPFGEGNTALGPLRLPDDGQYTLIVTRWLGAAGNTTGSYRARFAPLDGATPLPPTAGGVIAAYGRAVAGAISPELPAQVWAFEGALGDVIDIEISPLEGNLRPQVQLTPPDGQSFPAIEVNGAFRVALTARGRFGLTVSGAGGTAGGYRLRVARVADAGQAAVGRAEGIAYGDQREGRIDGATSAVAWVLFARAGERLIAEATADPDFDPYLRLIGPDGATLAVDDNTGGGLNARLANVVFSADGFYALVVSASPLGAAREGAFRLSVRRGQPGAVFQGGLDLGKTAGAVLNTERTLQEWHYHSVEGGPGVIAVQISAGGAAFRGRILLVGPDGKLISAAQGSRLEATLPGSGRYSILIAAEGGGAGAYRLTLEGVQRPE